jgi:BNR repeat-containing family member/PKD domain
VLVRGSRGVHHQGRTYVGWLERQGDVKMASYDHATRVRTTVVLRWRFGVDDHNNPALHVLPDGRLMVFYSRHGGGEMFYRTSRRPRDITAWGAEQKVPTNTRGASGQSHYTYPNPVQLSEENNRLWLFWRGGTSWPNFSTSTNNGMTWSRAQNWVGHPNNRPYIKFSTNKRDRIHFAFTQGHPARLNSNIYYARYRKGYIYRADGTRIKPTSQLPLLASEADEVYDTKDKAWVHDIAHTASGRPIIVFAVIDSAGVHHYRYSRWTGSAWKTRPVVRAGGSIADNGREPFYSGGITLDHENPSVVYLSRQVKGVFEVETWRTSDGGATWTRKSVTSGSSVENVRPVSPRGLLSFADDMSVLWLRGTYVHYVHYSTDITARLMNGGNLPPQAHMKVSPEAGAAPLTAQFDGRRSRDADGRIVRWSWTFGDGSRGTGSTPSHRYASPGRYFVKLTVTDDAGDRDAFVTEVLAT